jgi:hypothetical protein
MGNLTKTKISSHLAVPNTAYKKAIILPKLATAINSFNCKERNIFWFTCSFNYLKTPTTMHETFLATALSYKGIQQLSSFFISHVRNHPWQPEK